MSKDKIHGFSVRLLKEELNTKSIDEILEIGNSPIINEINIAQETASNANIIETGKIYHFKILEEYDGYLKKISNPDGVWWSNFLNIKPQLPTKNYSFVMLVPVSINNVTRKLVYTFGFGHTLIDDKNIEMNFGLKVALNSVDPEKLKSADKFAPTTQSKQTRTQLSIGSDLFGLGFNEFEEIIKKLSGLCKEEYKNIFSNVTGSDSLKINSSCKLEDIPELSKTILKLYSANDYKENPQLASVDKMNIEKDIVKINQLNKILLQNLNTNEPNIYLSNYEIIESEDVELYSYSGFSSVNKFNDLDIQDFFNEISEKSLILNEDNLQNYKIKVYKNENDIKPKQWKLYNCLVAEAFLDNQNYILSMGRWYFVDKTFIEKVDRITKTLFKEDRKFIDYDASMLNKLDTSSENLDAGGNLIDKKLQGEKRYNKMIASTSNLIMLDQKFIQINNSPYEACDIFDSEKNTFYHVKRKHSGSSDLSHLFSQGINSEKLASVDADQEYSTQFKKLTGVDLPQNRKIRFVIVAPPNKDGNVTIPIFSKITLYNTLNILKSMKCEDVGYILVKEINIVKEKNVKNKRNKT